MDVVTTLTTLSQFGVQLRTLLAAISALAGVWLFVSAGRVMVAAGHQSSYQPVKWGSIGTKIAIGGFLLQIAKMIEDIRNGLLDGSGSEVREMMTYGGVTASSGNGVWNLLISTAMVWVATIGAFAVFRGFLLWHKAGAGDAQGNSGDYFWQGFWHVLGGCVAINVGSSLA